MLCWNLRNLEIWPKLLLELELPELGRCQTCQSHGQNPMHASLMLTYGATYKCFWHLTQWMLIVVLASNLQWQLTLMIVVMIHAGTDGRAIVLQTNIFPVQMLHQYCLYQYHVDFNPQVPSIVIRKRLIEEKKEMFGGFYMFDGMQLYLQLKLEREVSFCL